MKFRSLLLAASFLTAAAPAFAQTLTINGSGTPGQTVSGSTMAVVAAGGSGDKTDAIYVCSPANGCAPANGYDYDYLNGTKGETQTAPFPTGGSFNMNVPSAPGNYNLTWYQADTNTNVVSLAFTVSSAPPPSAPSIDMSDGSHIAPVTGDVLGVNAGGAWAPVAGGQGSQGPAGPQGPQGPAGQNAGQNTYPACPAPNAPVTLSSGNTSMYCSANGHTDIAVAIADNTWVFFGPASATAP